MNLDKCAELQQLAAELYRLEKGAKAIREPFLAWLIAMARVEAERLWAGRPPPLWALLRLLHKAAVIRWAAELRGASPCDSSKRRSCPTVKTTA